MHLRTTRLLLLTTGLLFSLYALLRPYSSEVGTEGAEAFASPLWLASHVAAMCGFVALALFVRQARAGTLVETIALLGVVLVLPYYGAETFALRVLGRSALDTDRLDLLDLAEPIRFGLVQTVMFGVGLILIAVGTVMFAVRVGGAAALFAAGFVLFLPQFFAPPWLRIVHGLVILVGAAVLAHRLGPDRTTASARTGRGIDAGESSSR